MTLSHLSPCPSGPGPVCQPPIPIAAKNTRVTWVVSPRADPEGRSILHGCRVLQRPPRNKKKGRRSGNALAELLDRAFPRRGTTVRASATRECVDLARPRRKNKRGRRRRKRRRRRRRQRRPNGVDLESNEKFYENATRRLINPHLV